MATYLLAWNPKRWQWADLAEMAKMVKAGVVVTTRWGCGASRRIQKGDRAFFIRLGERPKGIFASGMVSAGSYEDLHWEARKAAGGETMRFVEVRFDTLLQPERDVILPRGLLDDARFSGMRWDTRMSGIQIPERVAAELEGVWANFAAG